MAINMQTLDFVITWVDGCDTQFQQKKEKYTQLNLPKSAVDSTRFAHQNEVYFCIASILKYAPYCGTIYLVTDQQTPKWLHEFVAQGICGENKIQVIDHHVLFQNAQEGLPTFNSLTIETMLYDIPNVSSAFIYLNDDFFFNAPSKITDFIEDHKIVIYGHWQSNLIKKLKYKVRQFFKGQKPLAPKYSTAQMLSADMLGLDQYYEIHHRPHVVQAQLLKTYFNQNPHILQAQIQHKFRHIEQFLPIGLSNHLAIQQHRAILKSDLKIAYLKNKDDTDLLIQQLNQTDIFFGCIQSLDQLPTVQQQKIQHHLIEKFKDFLPSQLYGTQEHES